MVEMAGHGSLEATDGHRRSECSRLGLSLSLPLPRRERHGPDDYHPGTNISFTPGPDPACLPPGFGRGFPGAAGTNGSAPANVTFPPFSIPTIKENTALTHYFNDGGNITTLNHTLWSVGVLPNATIADVMDVRGSFVCAEYL